MPSRDYIRRLAQEKFDGDMEKAFLNAVDKIKNDLTLADIERKIDSGDIEGAIKAVGLNQAAFSDLSEVTSSAVYMAGQETLKAVPADARVQFKPGNKRAERAIDELHSTKVREITTESEQAIRGHIKEGIRRGDNPRVIAEGIRGRWDGRRYRGGMIGLTSGQQEWVANTERQLLSGDKTEMRKYLNKKLRDKSFDRDVLEAINNDKPLNKSKVRVMTENYKQNAIAYRAETIARDQSLKALSEGQEAALDEVVENSKINNKDIIRQWITAGDARVRDVHSAVPGMNPGGVPRGDMFDTPLGQLRRPRDSMSPGSVPANIIQCRCSLSVRIRRGE